MVIFVALLSSALISVASCISVCENVYPHLPMSLNLKTEIACKEAGGCWAPDEEFSCFFPKIFGYEYKELSHEAGKTVGELTLLRASGALGGDFTDLMIDITQETRDRTHIKIQPKESPEGMRWEIPDFLIPRSEEVYIEDDVDTTVFIPSSSPFEIGIRNKKQVLFFMSKMLVFQDQYIEVVLSGGGFRETYGFGESSRLQQSLEENKAYTLWNSDVPAKNFNTSLYGSHPFMLHLLEDGSACGVLFLNSNAMSLTYSGSTDENPAAFGIQAAGGLIDFYVFAGPSPQDVVRQLQEVIGLPAMQPYWSLGLHNCRWGYTSVGEVAETVANYSAAGIPLETQWVDIDYMKDYLDFTTDPVNFPANDMKALVEKLHANNQYFVPIVDPGIFSGATEIPYKTYEQGMEQRVFVRDLTGENYFVGVVWPGTVHFPDWFAANTTTFWVNQLQDFYNLVPFDGIWIDMNEVSNFADPGGKSQVCIMNSSSPLNFTCSMVDPDNKYDNPPWKPPAPGPLGGRTLPMSAIHTTTDVNTGMQTELAEYNTHNLHGLMESIATHEAVAKATQSRPFVLSRSTTLSSGQYTAHWTGDNAATWADMKVSIISMKNLALFGIPMTGADICGFIDDSTEELCGRWAQVGGFSPFMRNHNELGSAPQEFYRWDSVAEIARNVIAMRYSLLPHLYTLMYDSFKTGATVMNGVWMNFPDDSEASSASVDGQYMWGSSLLFSPVLEEGSEVVSAYFPAGIWYSLFDNTVIDSTKDNKGEWVDLSTPFMSTNVHVRGGSIVPRHFDRGAQSKNGEVGFLTTTEARLAPFSLLVSLDLNGDAAGALYLDDGLQRSMDLYTHMQFTTQSRLINHENWHMLTSSVADVGPSGAFTGSAPGGNILARIEVNDWQLGEDQAVTCVAAAFLNIKDKALSFESVVSSTTDATAASGADRAVVENVLSVTAVYDGNRRRVTISLDSVSIPVASNFQVAWSCT